MKLSKKEIVLSSIILLIILVYIYMTPNNIIKTIAPKRYVFLCITNTLKEICELKEDKQTLHSNFNLEISKNSEHMIGISAFNDAEKFMLSCNEFFSSSYKGFNKNIGALNKYLSVRFLYYNYFNVRKSGEKSFAIVNGKNNIYSADEYEITLKKNFAQKFMKEIGPSINNDVTKSALENVLKDLGSDASIKVYPNKKHFIISTFSNFTYNHTNIFTEVILKDESVPLNNIAFMCNIENKDNITVTVKSSGIHKITNNMFTDETNIDVLSHFMKVAQFDAKTSINYNQSADNVNFELDSKILKYPMKITTMGSLNTDSYTEFKADFSFKTIKNDDINIKINYSENNNILKNNEPFDSINQITEEEKNNINNWINKFINSYVI